jgi:hypothetical protein
VHGYGEGKDSVVCREQGRVSSFGDVRMLEVYGPCRFVSARVINLRFHQRCITVGSDFVRELILTVSRSMAIDNADRIVIRIHRIRNRKHVVRRGCWRDQI